MSLGRYRGSIGVWGVYRGSREVRKGRPGVPKWGLGDIGDLWESGLPFGGLRESTGDL